MKRLLLFFAFSIAGIINSQNTIPTFPHHPTDYYRSVNRLSDQMLQGLNQLFVAFGKAPADQQEQLVQSLITAHQQMMPMVLMMEPYRGLDGKAPADSSLINSLRKFFHSISTEIIPNLEAMRGKMFVYPGENTPINSLSASELDAYERLMHINQITHEIARDYPEANQEFIVKHEKTIGNYVCDKLDYLMQRLALGHPDTTSRFLDAPPRLERLSAQTSRVVYTFGYGPMESLPQVLPQFEQIAQSMEQCKGKGYTLRRQELINGHSYLLTSKKGWGQSPSVHLILNQPRRDQGLVYRLELYN